MKNIFLKQFIVTCFLCTCFAMNAQSGEADNGMGELDVKISDFTSLSNALPGDVSNDVWETESEFAFLVSALPGDGADGGGLESVDAPGAPIDDFVWVLALVGLIWSFRKYQEILNSKIEEVK